MRVPMQPNLVSGIHYLAHLRWKRFSAVRGREPCRFDAVLGEEREEAVCAYRCAEDAARDVGEVRGCASAGVEPVGVLGFGVGEWCDGGRVESGRLERRTSRRRRRGRRRRCRGRVWALEMEGIERTRSLEVRDARWN